jgi:site-specific recombinase XerD
MTPLELETVRGVCNTLREKAMVDFLYSSACRVSEFCALNITDVNMTDHTIHIERGKGGKGRTTFLNPEAEISLRAYLASRNDDSPALFVGCRAPHNRLAVKAVQNEIQKIVLRSKVTVHVTPHIFRHTAASLALQRGMPLEQVQRFLGHSRIQTTLRYAKTLQADVQISHNHFVA